MDAVREITGWFLADSTELFVLRVVFASLMAVISAFVAFSTVKYVRDYRILQMVWAFVRGKGEELDRIRREQMKEAFKDSSDIMARSGKKPTLIQKVYRQISMSGIPGKIPGFSESAFFASLIAVCFAIVAAMSYRGAYLQGFVLAALLVAIVFYLLNILAYRRAIQVEDQLLDFVNLVASTSRQYSSLVDIFGMIYENFRAPLSTALEEAYIEAKQTSDTDRAMFHLKDKFNSVQFEFVIDNLLLCSKENGQYFDVAMDLSKIEKVYYNSFQKKRQLLNQAKATLSLMFAIAIGIVVCMGQFVGGGWREIVLTPVGTILAAIMVLLYVYALNMRAR